MHEVLITHRKAVKLCSKPQISQLSFPNSNNFPSLRCIGVFVWAGVLEGGGLHLPTAPSFTMALAPTGSSGEVLLRFLLL